MRNNNTARADERSIQFSKATAWPQRRWYKAYSQADDDAVRAIKAKYGIHSDEDAVRLALRLAAGDAIKLPAVSQSVARKVTLKFKMPGG